MKRKTIWLRMLVMVLVLGMSVVGCDNGSTNDGNNGSSNGGNTETIYNPEGTWDINIYGQTATVIVTGNSYTFSGGGITDFGTFTRNGNVGTMRTSNPNPDWDTNYWGNNAIVGTATLTSNTTMTLTLVEPSLITGVFVGHKR